MESLRDTLAQRLDIDQSEIQNALKRQNLQCFLNIDIRSKLGASSCRVKLNHSGHAFVVSIPEKEFSVLSAQRDQRGYCGRANQAFRPD
jgi:hypothetical protein